MSFNAIIFKILTFSVGFTTANKYGAPPVLLSLKWVKIENSGYNIAGRCTRAGALMLERGLIPNAGNPSAPLAMNIVDSSLNGTVMAPRRLCSTEKCPNKYLFCKKTN